VPFLYFGIHDGVDLSAVPWRRGRGYDVDVLTGVLTASEHHAHFVLKQLAGHVDDIARIRALGFCVSIEHARFMARVFQDAGVPATAIWGDSPRPERENALRALSDGGIRALFSVDLFNEGVDLPAVDTLLLLRPTDSPTLFLQQLGRGLRRAVGKTVCTVLDFVGEHRREFRMDLRLRALLGGSRKDLLQQIASGFPFLPAGCHMQLDAVASEIVLRNIKSSIPSVWQEKARELAALAAGSSSGDVTLAGFLEGTGLELEDVYSGNRSWSDLREAAGLATAPVGPEERLLRRGCGRMTHLDDSLRIETYRHMLSSPTPPRESSLLEAERRLLRMLVASLLGKAAGKGQSLESGASLLWCHPQVLAELRDLLEVLARRITHLQPSLSGAPEVPLRVHARYTRLEILAAFGVGGGARVAPWQSGVYWAEDARADLLAFTLDKTSGQFSPTTRYEDYAISPSLIHWESQSATRADSPTGMRYQRHGEEGSRVMLFARLRTDDRAFWFLGPARYVRHRSERPMAVTWRLDHALPGDLFASFAAAVA